MQKGQKKGNSLIAVLGPTAVGKTDVAIELAQLLNAPIISADSRQIYREMPIGTAQPGQEALDKASHYLIASHSITTPLSASGYAEEALEILKGIYLNRDHAILAGGSGFYVKALIEGLDKIPEVAPETRERLNREYESRGLPALQGELREADPEAFNQIDVQNPVRVIRALEVYWETGHPLSSYWGQSANLERPFDPIKIGLYLPRQQLYEKIEQRCEQMLEMGLLEEVKQLYPYRHLQVLQTVGYQEFFDYLDGKRNYADAVALFKQRTRQYAKRQLTWFRRDKEVQWFKPDESEAIQQYVQEQHEQSDPERR